MKSSSSSPSRPRSSLGARLISVALVARLGLVALPAAPPEGELTILDRPRFVPGSGPSLKQVVEHEGGFVAVGSDGMIVTSLDGDIWAVSDSGVKVGLTSLARGGEDWVAVGDDGTILVSKDLRRWERRDSWVRSALKAVAFAECRWVAVGESGVILTSYDTVEWRRRASGVAVELRAVAFGGGQFFVGGAERTLLRSVDCARWMPCFATGNHGFRDLLFTGDRLVAAGCTGVTAYTPAEGFLAPPRTAQVAPLWSMILGPEGGVGVGTHGLVVRFDAGFPESAWSVVESGTSRSLLGVAYGRGRWVAVGAHGTVLVSEDGRRWRMAGQGLAAGQRGEIEGKAEGPSLIRSRAATVPDRPSREP